MHERLRRAIPFEDPDPEARPRVSIDSEDLLAAVSVEIGHEHAVSLEENQGISRGERLRIAAAERPAIPPPGEEEPHVAGAAVTYGQDLEAAVAIEVFEHGDGLEEVHQAD